LSSGIGIGLGVCIDTRILSLLATQKAKSKKLKKLDGLFSKDNNYHNGSESCMFVVS